MNKPYTICYMMTSVDGRIDCAMTGQFQGVDQYYRVLSELDMPTTLSGRNTAELEMSLPGKFEAKDPAPCGREGFSRKAEADGYEVVVDTHGKLLWDKEDADAHKPHLIVTSTSVPKEYLDYLDAQNISWIACGTDKIDLIRASEILSDEFGVRRMGIVGGPTINTAFLDADLLDEIVILIGPGIDGRAAMPSVFEGRDSDKPLPLILQGVESYDNGTVLLQYKLK